MVNDKFLNLMCGTRQIGSSFNETGNSGQTDKHNLCRRNWYGLEKYHYTIL